MISLTELHKNLILRHLREGDTAVDYTMGNGYDTVFLSKTVGVHGKVYAFDIQQSALDSTKRNLTDSGCPENYTLICASHHRVKEFVHEPVKAGMFNLGYLPGGDKNITTLRETTLAAIDAAIELMDRDAIILIAVYPGHEEGDIEGKLVGERLEKLDRKRYMAACFKMMNSPTSPFFYVIESK